MDFTKIQPSDAVVVYHGTRVAEVFELINGFDATRTKYRHYGGPRHAGLFVTPDFKVAERFSPYGELVLEMVVRAKNLHGVDYSGNIGRKQDMSERTLRSLDELYPESFRPYLTMTITQSSEPQALLLGLVSPKQVRRVWYNPNREGGAWYTREEFLALGLEVTPAIEEPYGPKRPLKDYGLDMSSPRTSVDQLLEALSRLHGRDISSYFRLYRNNLEALTETLGQLGFGPLAARSHAKKLVDHFSRAKLARILREEGLG